MHCKTHTETICHYRGCDPDNDTGCKKSTKRGNNDWAKWELDNDGAVDKFSCLANGLYDHIQNHGTEMTSFTDANHFSISCKFGDGWITNQRPCVWMNDMLQTAS